MAKKKKKKKLKKKNHSRSSCHGVAETNPTRSHEIEGFLPGLDQWIKDPVFLCAMDPTLLWLWCRPMATAPIRPLAWEPPYAAGAAQEMAKKKKKKDKTKKGIVALGHDVHAKAISTGDR